MKKEVYAPLIEKTLANAEEFCGFLFQGGEPTLAGIEFYESFIQSEKIQNVNNIPIFHSIQTNGLRLDEAWAAFFARHRFLVGLSVDGTQALHDRFRTDCEGGTFERVRRAAALLERYHVPFTILTVVTGPAAEHAEEIYRFFREAGWNRQQYIPCLEPLGEARGGRAYSLSPAKYGRFLCDLFDAWFADLLGGAPVSVRYFDNLVRMLRGEAPESCGMLGECARLLVAEADGRVYPCDFYVLDSLCIGDIRVNTLEEIERRRDATGFLQASHGVAAACRSCRWRPLCRGGCRRDRETPEGLSVNAYCASFQMFFPHAAERLVFLARQQGPHG